MKNIFKKLHRNHDHSNRINETPSSPLSISTTTTTTTSSGSSDHRETPLSPSSNPSTSSNPSNQSDYFTSEEEFQVQLALAISASNSQFREDRDKDQIREATLLSLGPQKVDSWREREGEAEALSRRYWDYNVLDYEEKVVDGFYDIYGHNVGPASQGKMPSLVDLQTKNGDPRFEVVVVNRAIDPALEELHQVAQCIALDCSATEVCLLVQRLADLVTEHMGGPVMDANIMFAKWLDRTTELQTSLQTSILPIGSLNTGLSRHRALLFKVLLDNVGISCRLVKGSHYTGNDDDAINIVKLENEREFLVDLMAAPGTLIPADILNLKDTSFTLCEPGFSKSPQAIGDLNIDISALKPPHGAYKAGSQKSNFENTVSLDKKPSSDPSHSSKSHGVLPVSMIKKCDNTNGLVPANQSSFLSSFVAGSSFQYEGNHGDENLNAVEYPQETMEESKKLFADLNPFQIKISAQNKHTDREVKDFQRRRENLVSGPGRPPLPLMWKNRPTCNEISKTKQYEFGEGILPRNIQEANRHKASSLVSSITATSEKDYPEVSNESVSGFTFPDSTRNSNGEPMVGLDSALTFTSNLSSMSISDGGDHPVRPHISTHSPDTNHHKEHSSDVEVLQNKLIGDTKEQPKDLMGKLGVRKCTHDRFLGNDSSSVDACSSRLDPMLDDVAEWEIPWEDLAIGERIGLGSYGEVYHADWNDREVAVKKFLDQDFSGDALDEFRSEVRIMLRLRHPNVVLFLGAVTRPPNLSIVTEFLPRGSLYRIVHRPNCQIDEKRRIKMALDVAMGMTCLHASMPTVVHRDLKSPNLLVDMNWNVKVSDFGLSRLKHNTFLSSKSTAGTPEWMAPEVLRNEQSNEKCDVYSFGVILWELATLKMPWTGMNPMQVVGAVGFQSRRLDIPTEMDPLVARIIRGCWQTDPNLRPSFAQLVATLQPLQRLTIPSLQQNSD